MYSREKTAQSPEAHTHASAPRGGMVHRCGTTSSALKSKGQRIATGNWNVSAGMGQLNGGDGDARIASGRTWWVSESSAPSPHISACAVVGHSFAHEKPSALNV